MMTVTVLKPVVAVGLTVMLAVTEVAVLKVTELTTTPDPKLT